MIKTRLFTLALTLTAASGGIASAQLPDPGNCLPQAASEDFTFRLLPNAALLFRTGPYLILKISNGFVDSLPARIRSEGCIPEQVNMILLDFIHGNTIDGLSPKGTRAFPNAVIYIDGYWTAASGAAASSSDGQADHAYIQKTLEPYTLAGKVVTFDKDMLILPRVTAHARHTSAEFTLGSTSFRMNFPKRGIVGSRLFMDD